MNCAYCKDAPYDDYHLYTGLIMNIHRKYIKELNLDILMI